jgi:hypothetical protein
MTKKNKILTICSIAGFLLLSFVLNAISWSASYWSVFSFLWDDELAGIIWPIILILVLIVYLFLRKKDHTGLGVVKKTLWVVFVVLGLVSLAFSVFIFFLFLLMGYHII